MSAAERCGGQAGEGIRPRRQIQAQESRSEVLRELRKKRRLWKKAKNGGNKEEYEQAAKRVKNLIRSAKRSLEKKTGK